MQSCFTTAQHNSLQYLLPENEALRRQDGEPISWPVFRGGIRSPFFIAVLWFGLWVEIRGTGEQSFEKKPEVVT